MAGCLSVLPGLLLSSITETRYCISDHLLWCRDSVVRWPGTSGRCIPRAPGRPVDLDRHALRVDPRLDQVERKIRTGLREQSRALAEDHRDHDQTHLVDQIVLQQPPGQGATAVHLQLTPGLGLQLTDGRREVTAENGRVLPTRRGN